MIDVAISYSSRGAKVTGPERVSSKTVEDMFDFVKTATYVTAEEFKEKLQAKGEFPKEEIEVITDGKIGRNPKLVKAFGKIEYVTKLENIGDVLVEIMALVDERSPSRSGYYRSMNVLMLNGTIIARSTMEAISYFKNVSGFSVKDKFRVINLSPYARRLERKGIRRGTRGKSKGVQTRRERKTKTKVGGLTNSPNGAYWLAKNTARRSFPLLKNNIKFSFVPVPTGIAASANRKSFSRYSFKKSGRPYFYPSITVTVAPNAFASNAGFTEPGGNL